MSYRDEYYIQRDRRGAPEVDVSVVSDSSSKSRTPAFLTRDEPRAGEMVLRSRKVEQGYSRRRSPSPVRYEEQRMARVARSVSPIRERARTRSRPPAEQRVRVVGRERSVSPEGRVRVIGRERSVSPEGRVRIVGRTKSLGRRRGMSRDRSRSRERSTSADRFRARIDVTERCNVKERSPSPEPAKVIKGPVIKRDVVTHWTDVDHRKRTPSPPPMPKKIQGPTMEREVITHWHDVDHGVIRARSPSPVCKTRDTDVDIDINHRHHRDHHHTDIDVDVDIHHSQSPHRKARSRSHVRRKSVERRPPAHFHDDTEVVIRTDRERLRWEESNRRKHRSHSAVPLRSPSPSYSDEADYITSRIDARGRMGESYNGHTKDWDIVDVPPGTERVRMDGVGGGSAEVNWSRYSGVRRSNFIPEREPEPTPRNSNSALVGSDSAERDRDMKMSVQIYGRDSREERKTKTPSDMWTEITKDLICKEAIERMGYQYEETEWFYYVMEYLKYEDVLEIIDLSDRIQDSRRRRARELEREREHWEQREHREQREHSHHIDITASHNHNHSHSQSRPGHRSRRWDEFDPRESERFVDRRAFS